MTSEASAPIKVSFSFYPADMTALNHQTVELRRLGAAVRRGTVLRALIERDLEQGKAEEARFRAATGDGPAAELIAQIRAWSRPDADRKRFVAGMLSAVAHDPGLLDPIRCHHQAECAARTWDEAGIRGAILKLAAAGMFWSEFFGCSEVPPEQRPAVIAQMETLARQWTMAPDPPPAAPPPRRKPRS